MSWLSALIAGGAALVGQGVNAWSQSRQNFTNRNHAIDMWNRQGERELMYWNMQNAYNDPLAQMQRLSNAGLNPNLVYGNGAKTEAASLSAKGPNQPSMHAPQVDLGSVVQQALMTRQAEANINRTQAEAEAIRARTVDQNFKNEVNSLVGVESYYRAQAFANEALEQRSLSEQAKLRAELAGLFNTPEGVPFQIDDPNSPAAKAARAGAQKAVTEAELALELRELRKFENVIKEFEANLARQGISPNSPFYVKIIGDLLDRVLPGGMRAFLGISDRSSDSLTPQF